jgi:hypothetical protein
VSFWNKLFSAKTKTDNSDEKSKFLPEEKDPVEITFAKNFTDKGGKFIYSENSSSTDRFFSDILKENNWQRNDVLCIDENLADRFELECKKNQFDFKDFPVFLIDSEFLIGDQGTILICNHQLKDFKLEQLPPCFIVFSGLKQFASDVSDGMSKLKEKHAAQLPNNITTLNVKNIVDENNYLTYGSSAKNLYLLLQES